MSWVPWFQAEVVDLDTFKETELERKERLDREWKEHQEQQEKTQPRYLPGLFRQDEVQ